MALLALFVVHANALRFTQDDAYISLRYARNLVDGHGLVFNPGERIEGYSNFSWTLIRALFLWLGTPAVETALWLGMAFGALAIVFAARLARSLEGSLGPTSVLTVLFAAGNSAFALWSTGGLETAFFTFLVTAGLERGLAPRVSEKGRAAAPLLFFLAATTRPEGPIFFAAWFLIRVIDTERGSGPAASANGWRGLARDFALFAIPLLPYLAWKLAYYGDLLPNTYFAKAGLSKTYLVRGLDYANEFFEHYAVWGLVPILGLACLGRGGVRTVEARLLGIWILYAVYIVAIGGDVLHVHRFWVPVVPLGSVLLARGLTWIAEVAATRADASLRANTRSPVSRPMAGRGALTASAALFVGLALTAGTFAANWKGVRERRRTEIQFVDNMRETALWLKRSFPKSSTVAATTIGAIAYWSELRVLDMLGLTDREIARSPKLIDGLTDTWREVKYNAESVLARRPDCILFSTGIRPSSAAEKALFLYETLYESYFHYFFFASPTRKNSQVILRLRPDAPAVHLTRLDVTDFEFFEEYSEGLIKMSRERDFSGASASFRRAVEIAGDEFVWGKEALGIALFDSGDPAGIVLLREVAERDPYALLAHNRVADWTLANGDLDEADARFRRLRDVDPDDPAPWIGAARVARLRGEFEEAFRLAYEANQRCSINSSYLITLGSLALQTNRIDIAERSFARAVAIDADSELARQGLEIIQRARAEGGFQQPGTADRP